MMSEKAARKLGEVLAFSQAMTELINKANSSFEAIWGKEEVNKLLNIHMELSDDIIEIAKSQSVFEITAQKAEKTKEKLNSMRDLYIRDEWENPTEILEWLGFFVGAMIVHWSLVAGVGDAQKLADLLDMTRVAMQHGRTLLEEVKQHLYEVGKKI